MKAPLSQPTPNRLAVYRALCELSPEAYAPLARMILATLSGEIAVQQRRIRRRNRRYIAQAGNISKPVITLGGDDREGA